MRAHHRQRQVRCRSPESARGAEFCSEKRRKEAGDGNAVDRGSFGDVLRGTRTCSSQHAASRQIPTSAARDSATATAPEDCAAASLVAFAADFLARPGTLSTCFQNQWRRKPGRLRWQRTQFDDWMEVAGGARAVTTHRISRCCSAAQQMATYPYFILSPSTILSVAGFLRGPEKVTPTPVED